MDILKGNVFYFPNSQASGCPYHAMLKGETGYISHEEKIDARKVRERSDSFADHFSQARLFFHSMSPIEQLHIVKALSFELSKVQDAKIRERRVAILNQIDENLAKKVGKNLSITPSKNLDELTLKFARQNHPNYPLKNKKVEVETSNALSMVDNINKAAGIQTRKVAFLINEGASAESVQHFKTILEKEGAEAVLVAEKVGPLILSNGDQVDIKKTYTNDSSVFYDALYTPDGKSVNSLVENPNYFEVIKDAYLHCKAIAFDKDAEKLFEKTSFKKDKAVVYAAQQKDWTKEMITLMKNHRYWQRELDME